MSGRDGDPIKRSSTSTLAWRRFGHHAYSLFVRYGVAPLTLPPILLQGKIASVACVDGVADGAFEL